MPEESFGVKDLAIVIARILSLEKNDVVQVQTNRFSPDEIKVKVLRHPGQEKPT